MTEYDKSEIVGLFRSGVSTGKFVPGQPFNFKGLAETFKLNASIVAAILSELVSNGYIQRTNKGSYEIRKYSNLQIDSAFSFASMIYRFVAEKAADNRQQSHARILDKELVEIAKLKPPGRTAKMAKEPAIIESMITSLDKIIMYSEIHLESEQKNFVTRSLLETTILNMSLFEFDYMNASRADCIRSIINQESYKAGQHMELMWDHMKSCAIRTLSQYNSQNNESPLTLEMV